jgi:acetylornithine deacetylase/succinyl-diaminopimelate desuccinylase-like protein
MGKKLCSQSVPDKGRNAKVMATGFVQEMDAFIRQHFPDRDHLLYGSPTMTVGTIKGGDGFPNMVPDHCELMIDRCWDPNETF